MKHSTNFVRLSSLLVVAGLVAIGVVCASSRPRVAETPAAAQPARHSAARRVIRGHGYAPQFSFEEHFNFPAANLAFEGVVERVHAPRHVKNETFEHVYSPVEVRVTRVLRGQLSPGSRIFLRAFGGVADDVEFQGDLVASEDVTKVGNRILVIGSAPVVVEGDTFEAVTANAVYARTGEEVVEVTYAHRAPGRAHATLEQARKVVGQRVF